MNNILDDVTKVSENISPLSVVGLLLITQTSHIDFSYAP